MCSGRRSVAAEKRATVDDEKMTVSDEETVTGKEIENSDPRTWGADAENGTMGLSAEAGDEKATVEDGLVPGLAEASCIGKPIGSDRRSVVARKVDTRAVAPHQSRAEMEGAIEVAEPSQSSAGHLNETPIPCWQRWKSKTRRGCDQLLKRR